MKAPKAIVEKALEIAAELFQLAGFSIDGKTVSTREEIVGFLIEKAYGEYGYSKNGGGGYSGHER